MIEHFIQTLNIEISRPLLQKLTNKGIVFSIPCLFTLNTKNLALVGVNRTKAKPIVASIEAASQLPYNIVLRALCPYITQEQANALCSRFASFELMQKATAAQLQKVQSFSPDEIDAFIKFINNPQTKAIIYKLRKHVQQQQGKPVYMQVLSGVCFCLSGKFNDPREVIKEYLITHGAICTSNMSASVNFLLAGTDADSHKLALAQKLNIPLITFDEVVNIVTRKEEEAANAADADNSLTPLPAPFVPTDNRNTHSLTIKLLGCSVAEAYAIARSYNIIIYRKHINSQTLTLYYDSVNDIVNFVYNCNQLRTV
jgi:DNA ligase (NAD+)